jgi:hypothetical protein
LLQTFESSPILFHTLADTSSLSSQIPVPLFQLSFPPSSNIAPLSNPTRLWSEIFLKKNKSSKIIKNSQRMVGQRSPASRRKRFRFVVLHDVASNSRWLIFVESETAISMSPFGCETIHFS